jgi:hypothetical protein
MWIIKKLDFFERCGLYESTLRMWDPAIEKGDWLNEVNSDPHILEMWSSEGSP